MSVMALENRMHRIQALRYGRMRGVCSVCCCFRRLGYLLNRAC